MKEIIFNVEEDGEAGGFVAEAYISDSEQIVTQGDSIDELKKMIQDALECHFEIKSEMPHKVIMKFVRQEVFAF
ncbi:MAG: 2-oxoisovalerate dehydrogenase [Bacteroidetes bacterium]|nr:2-oxoisovalerate dehydrogenase [Bacteroidota bacterium]